MSETIDAKVENKQSQIERTITATLLTSIRYCMDRSMRENKEYFEGAQLDGEIDYSRRYYLRLIDQYGLDGYRDKLMKHFERLARR